MTESGRTPSRNPALANLPRRIKEFFYKPRKNICPECGLELSPREKHELGCSYIFAEPPPQRETHISTVAEVLLGELITAYEELHRSTQTGEIRHSPTDERFLEAVRWVNRQEFFEREIAEEEELNDDSIRR